MRYAGEKQRDCIQTGVKTSKKYLDGRDRCERYQMSSDHDYYRIELHQTYALSYKHQSYIVTDS